MKRITQFALVCLLCMVLLGGTALAAEDTAASIQDGFQSRTANAWTKDEDGIWVVPLANGYAKEGWFQDGSSRYYLTPWESPGYCINEIAYVESDTTDGYMWYAFDKDGKSKGVYNGWKKDPETGTYSYIQKGYEVQGWKTIGGVTYYLSPEMYYDGWYRVEGDFCYFDKNGAYQPSRKPPVNGWLTTWDMYYTSIGLEWDSNRYYFKDGGYLYDGWETIDGKEYCFDVNGTVMKGSYSPWSNGTQYLFDDNGALLTSDGWKKVEGFWYYLWKDELLTGAWLIDGKDYYFRDDGILCETTGYVGSKYVPIRADGTYVPISERKGWVKLRFASEETSHLEAGTGWVYFDSNGEIVKGWKTIGGVTYYFDDYDGWMYNSGLLSIYDNTTHSTDAYFFDKDGAMRTGWQKSYGSWYYLDPANGGAAVIYQWKFIDGQWYYFDGYEMATYWLMVDDTWNYFGSDGAWKH